MPEIDPSASVRPPLEGSLELRSNIEQYMGEQDVNQLIQFLNHDGSFNGETLHANGRNVTIPLIEPGLPLYDAMQISGGAYIPIGLGSNNDTSHGVHIMEANAVKEIHPPAQTKEQFTHSYFVARGGELVEKHDKSPMGSYAQTLAERKLDMTVRASSINSEVLIVPRVLGKHTFTDLADGQGGEATALIFAVPCQGERTDSSVGAYLLSAIAQPDMLKPLLRQYMPPILKTLNLVGEAAYDIHASGTVHNQLTLGNVLALLTEDGSSQLYVADWETAEQYTAQDAELARTLDLVVAFRSYAGMLDVLRENTELSVEENVSLLYAGLTSLLSGYTGYTLGDIQEHIAQNPSTWSEVCYAMHQGGHKANTYRPVSLLIQELLDD